MIVTGRQTEPSRSHAMTTLHTVTCPNLGDGQQAVPVLELLATPGQHVEVDASLMMLESDKSTIEIPSPVSGIVDRWLVTVGESVSAGQALLTVVLDVNKGRQGAAADGAPQPNTDGSESAAVSVTVQPGGVASDRAKDGPSVTVPPDAAPSAGSATRVGGSHYASPSVRRFARELGVDLSCLQGTGSHGRIVKEDVQRYVKTQLVQPRVAPSAEMDSQWSVEDFAKYGEVEELSLSRIQKRSGANLVRSWASVPHVTSFDSADITELDAFRRLMDDQRAEGEPRLSWVAFLIRASVVALQRFPRFNASLAQDSLVIKRYFHIGFAADTPAGLVVPVVRDCDRKGLQQIALEVSELAALAKKGKLPPTGLRGGTFTVSSLGALRGRGFTPIINVPEVAILGASRAVTQPVWRDDAFSPRLFMPLNLSWDHRVVDGVAAARFLGCIADTLEDFRRAAL